MRIGSIEVWVQQYSSEGVHAAIIEMTLVGESISPRTRHCVIGIQRLNVFTTIFFGVHLYDTPLDCPF